jgi:hypothetical protein
MLLLSCLCHSTGSGSVGANNVTLAEVHPST